MKTTRRMGLAAGGVASLVVAGIMAPGAYATSTDGDDVNVSNTETVQVLMDAAGKINSQRVYEQLVLTGQGSIDLANPVSTEGLRNLNGFGGFDVSDDAVRVESDVSGTEKIRSVSDFTKELPLKLEVTYILNGRTVKPGDVVGKRGTLEVRYRVTNTTGVEEDVVFDDGLGAQKMSRESVVIPMVGSLTTLLPSTFTKVSSAEANAAGDGKGNTRMSFTMTLIPPIGKDTATFGYTAQIKDGVVPKATLSALPVDPLQSPSFKGGADAYKGGAETGQELTAGATEIDANVLKIRDGAAELVDGILLLHDGAGQLSAGLNNEAAPGARRLADGAGQLDAGAGKLDAGAGKLDAGAGKLDAGAGRLDAGTTRLKTGTGDLNVGAKKLDKGAGDLADGLKTAEGSAPALLDGVNQLQAGAQQIDAGLTALHDQAVPGLNQISAGATSLLAAVNGPLSTNLDNIVTAADAASALVQNSPTLDNGEKPAILTQIGTAKALAQGVKAALNDTTGPPTPGFEFGLLAIQGGAGQLATGIAGATGPGGTLKNGMAQVIGGLDLLETGGLELVAGLGQLSDGASLLSTGTGDLKAGTKKLNTGAAELKAGTGRLKSGTGDLAVGTGDLVAGTGQLASGTGRLTSGASQLSTGLGDAASGSGRLTDGLGQAAESSPALPEGADRLSKEGTSQLIEAGDTTAKDFGLRYALLASGAERAGGAQPYGSPEGATALTAYTYELAAASGAESANLKRGLGALGVLAACVGLAAIRRVGA